MNEEHQQHDTEEAAAWDYWGKVCAAMPPMTPQQIENAAYILRQIDHDTRKPHTSPRRRRRKPHHH